MGMFDELIVDSEKLPVSKKNQIKLKGEVFQTKSLDNALYFYEITDDNRLRYKRPFFDDTEYFYNDFHGFIKFYTSIDEEWFEFKAKFTDGICVEISLLENMEMG